MSWLMQNYGMVCTVLLGVLEAASFIPSVGASGYLKFFITVTRLLATTDPEKVGDNPDTAKVASEKQNPKI